MTNETVKIKEDRTLWSAMTGMQKFMLGVLSSLIAVACLFLAVKFSHIDFSQALNIQNQAGVEKTEKLTEKELYRTNLENQTAKKVQNVLEKIVGKDNVSVQVNAEIDFNSTKATIEKYKPVSGSLTEKEIKQIVSEPGAIKRITVAVAVNKILTSKEKQELKDLVASASGVDFARGDAVSISDLRFLGLAETKAEQANLAKKAEIAMIFKVLINDLLPLGVALAIGILAVMAIKQIFKKAPEKNLYAPQSVQTSINYDAYEPAMPVEFVNNTQSPDETYDEEQDYKPEIGQIKEDLNKTILSNTSDAAKLLISYIKD